jgi:hypothetical protein
VSDPLFGIQEFRCYPPSHGKETKIKIATTVNSRSVLFININNVFKRFVKCNSNIVNTTVAYLNLSV